MGILSSIKGAWDSLNNLGVGSGADPLYEYYQDVPKACNARQYAQANETVWCYAKTGTTLFYDQPNLRGFTTHNDTNPDGDLKPTCAKIVCDTQDTGIYHSYRYDLTDSRCAISTERDYTYQTPLKLEYDGFGNPVPMLGYENTIATTIKDEPPSEFMVTDVAPIWCAGGSTDPRIARLIRQKTGFLPTTPTPTTPTPSPITVAPAPTVNADACGTVMMGLGIGLGVATGVGLVVGGTYLAVKAYRYLTSKKEEDPEMIPLNPRGQSINYL